MMLNGINRKKALFSKVATVQLVSKIFCMVYSVVLTAALI